MRKIIVYDGHKGPKEIGVNSEFLEWLTDPVLNGGGAVTDFGCYGADLITWILKGEKPLTVYADLKQYKPDVYPKVDDDATIILIIPAWKVSFMLHGTGRLTERTCMYMDQPDISIWMMHETIRYRLDEKSKESVKKIPLSDAPFNDPFAFFAAAIKGEVNS